MNRSLVEQKTNPRASLQVTLVPGGVFQDGQWHA